MVIVLDSNSDTFQQARTNSKKFSTTRSFASLESSIDVELHRSYLCE